MSGLPTIGLVTCSRLPEPDPDQQNVLDGFRYAGFTAELLPWDSLEADPSRFDTCLLRSCWNYHRHPDRFCEWLRSAAAVTRVINSPELVLWNLSKRYLLDLATRGVPIVPTIIVSERRPDLLSLLDEQGWTDFVIKPAISAGSYKTNRFGIHELQKARAAIHEILRTGECILQPTLRSVFEGGEKALVCIDGTVCHAVVKQPRFAGDTERVALSTATPDEVELAKFTLSRLSQVPTYARIDLIRGDNSVPLVSEVELIEPSLFFLERPATLPVLIEAVRRAVG